MANSKTSKVFDLAGNTLEILSEKTPDATETVRSAAQPILGEMGNIADEFVKGLFGIGTSSVEIYPGQSVEMGKKSQTEEASKPVSLEVTLFQEMRRRDETRIGELRNELRIIAQELSAVRDQIEETTQELDVAIIQAQNIINPGKYHVNYLYKFLEDLLSFKKQIGKAKIWLQSFNARGAKKGWLANYKQHGAKYLLSGEHYMSRSAG